MSKASLIFHSYWKLCLIWPKICSDLSSELIIFVPHRTHMGQNSLPRGCGFLPDLRGAEVAWGDEVHAIHKFGPRKHFPHLERLPGYNAYKSDIYNILYCHFTSLSTYFTLTNDNTI